MGNKKWNGEERRKQEEGKHYFDIDCHKPGDKGFKKLNSETGKEDIRGLVIPTESAAIRRLKNIIDGKQRGNKK